MFKLCCTVCQRHAAKSLCEQCWLRISPLEYHQSRSLLLLDSVEACFPLVAYASYQAPLKQLLVEIKYNKQKKLAFCLGQYLGAWYVQNFPLPDFILAVPLASERLAERGFNQAYEMARGLSSQIHRPVLNILRRTKNTRPLYNLRPEERISELSGVFAFKKETFNKIKNRRVILFDDIFTTGSTLKELAKIIHPYTKKVVFLSLARTLIAEHLD